MATTPPTQTGNQVNSGVAKCPYLQRKPCDVDKLMIHVTAFDDNFTGEAKPGGAAPGVRKKLTLKVETTVNHRRYKKAPTDPKGAKLHSVLLPRSAARRAGDAVTNLSHNQLGADHPARLLQSYDLLIDAIADFPKIDKPGPGAPEWKKSFLSSLKPDPMDLVEIVEVRAQFVDTQTCTDQVHSFLKIHAHDAPDFPQDVTLTIPGANNLKKQGIKLSAPSLPFHDLPTSGFVLFELIKSLLHCTQPKRVEFTAMGCGKRKPGDPKEKTPNFDMLGLLRIYRRDKWTIGVKIPPLGNYKDTREASKRGDLFGASTGDRERKTEGGVAGGLIQRNTTDKVEGGNASRSDERWLANRGWSEETGNLGSNNYRANRYSGSDGRLLDDSGTTVLSNMNMRLSRASGFAFVVAHNDRELNVGEFVEKFKKWLETFAKIVTDFQKLFKMIPKVGWTFDFTIAVFEGWVGLEWAPAYVDDGKPIYDGRYCAVEYQWKGRIELTVIDLKVAVGFGIQVELAGGLGELVCKVEGSLSFKAKVAHDINMDLFKPKERFDVECSGGPELTAKANVTVLGYTLIGGQLSVGGGLELKGCVEIEWSTKTFGLKGELKRKPILLTGSIQYPTWWGGTRTRKIDPPIEIIGEGLITTFS